MSEPNETTEESPLRMIPRQRRWSSSNLYDLSVWLPEENIDLATVREALTKQETT